MDTSSALLNIKNVDAAYGAIKALHGVSLHIGKGEIVTLIGANGAGKSTLLMSIFGNPRISAGEIEFEGKAISSHPPHKISKLGIALVPEGRRVFPKMTVEENLAMGAIASNDKEAKKNNLDRIYAMFPRLFERKAQNAGTMSGGEQQMLAIGRALMSQPKLLLLDEPSLGLAPIIVKQIFRTLEQICSDGTTIFLVEQNASKALSLASRGYVMVNGEIKLTGTGKELLSDPEVRKAYLGEH
ncbi:MAG: ABC transporter ATP-binding protein [Oligoflexales bacterium]